ncbi:MAG: DivIVA domain-containing protein [Bacilli bacterium]|nr:DivIVA domain-containing protein [Bacilli bacterium]MBR1817710.1 DivIVA domain-containing protein [Bacilli bacterium]
MKKFSTSFSGYNKSEVNSFVSDVAKEYESMLNNLKSRDQEIHALKEKLLQYQNMENTLNKALLVAEDASNQIKRMARDESKTIIDDAKRNASRIVNDALMRAEKLEADGENLRKRIVIFKRKFRSIIEAELENIDEIDENL